MSGDATLGTEGEELDKTIDDDMDQIDKVGEIPALEMEEPEFSPFHHLFAALKWIIGMTWLVLVIMLRAHTREQVRAPARRCPFPPVTPRVSACEREGTHTRVLTLQNLLVFLGDCPPSLRSQRRVARARFRATWTLKTSCAPSAASPAPWRRWLCTPAPSATSPR